MNFDAGRMRHRIRFERFDGTRDAYGDPLTEEGENWTPVVTLWGSVDPVSGREFYAAEQSQSEVTHKIRCRYYPGLQTEMRIVCAGRIFQVISIIDWEERHESLLIMAKELVK